MSKPLKTILVLLPLLIFIAVCALAWCRILYFDGEIDKEPKINIESDLKSLDSLPSSTADKDKLEYSKWRALITLEAASLRNQYNQANTYRKYGMWINFLTFITGMALVLAGIPLIVGNTIKHSSNEKLQESFKKYCGIVILPGFILAVLGAMIIMSSVYRPFEAIPSFGPQYINVDSKTSLLESQLPEESARNGNSGKVTLSNHNAANELQPELYERPSSNRNESRK